MSTFATSHCISFDAFVAILTNGTHSLLVKCNHNIIPLYPGLALAKELCQVLLHKGMSATRVIVDIKLSVPYHITSRMKSTGRGLMVIS